MNTQSNHRPRFDALAVSLDLLVSLRELRITDTDLLRQMRRAAQSIALNLAEGQRRVGKDRLHFFRIAGGSVAETRVALRIAVACDDLAGADGALELLDRLAAMTWWLSR